MSPWGDEFIGCLGGLLCLEYHFDSYPPAPPRHFVALSPSRGRKGRGSLQPHKKSTPFRDGFLFISFLFSSLLFWLLSFPAFLLPVLQTVPRFPPVL